MNLGAFWEYVKQSQLRFYQERDLSLDLCHNGWPGWLVGTLLVAVVVVFLLAIFHVIPARKHVTGLLLGLGLVAFLTGGLTSYSHWGNLPELESKLFGDATHQRPTSEPQKGAVVVLPLILGTVTLALGVAGCCYMAIFWATGKKKPG